MRIVLRNCSPKLMMSIKSHLGLFYQIVENEELTVHDLCEIEMRTETEIEVHLNGFRNWHFMTATEICMKPVIIQLFVLIHERLRIQKKIQKLQRESKIVQLVLLAYSIILILVLVNLFKL